MTVPTAPALTSDYAEMVFAALALGAYFRKRDQLDAVLAIAKKACRNAETVSPAWDNKCRSTTTPNEGTTTMAKNDEPPKPKGECPGGNTHNWVRDGHDMKCTNCSARYTVD